MTEFEKEKFKRREIVLKKKQAELKLILGQIEGNQELARRMKIEEQRQLEMDEAERQKLKLLEQMVATELRQKLMEILG